MSETLNNGRLFGPGLPGTGKLVAIEFHASYLYLDSQRQIAVSSLNIDAGGFSADSMTIEWIDGDHSFALVVEDVKVAQRLMSDMPVEIRGQTHRYQKSVNRRRVLWQTIVGLAACLVVAIGLLWWNYNEAVDWVASQIPPETEVRIGESALEQFTSSHEMLEDSAYLKMVVSIGEQLTTDSAYDYQWHVVDVDDVNAFAMPGGIVVVYRGLIDRAETPEELAGVLAHEIQHVEQQHSLQGMIHALGWSTLLAVVMGDVSVVATILAFEVGATYYSRELESAADIEGVQTLYEARIDPTGMVGFFESLIEDSGDSTLKILSTHPSLRKRIEALQATIDELPPRNYRQLPVDWQQIKARSQVSASES